MSSQERGFMIAEAVSAMNFEYHLKLLARERDRRTKRKKKEACTGGAAQTSQDLSANKTYIHYRGKGGICQEGRQDNPSTVFDGPPSWCSRRAL